jgi:phosphoglycerate dehydrogenase-like enzyme
LSRAPERGRYCFDFVPRPDKVTVAQMTDNAHRLVYFEDWMDASDFITLHCPMTDETLGMFGAMSKALLAVTPQSRALMQYPG